MAKAKYKPLSFTTTIRNPERIPAFLKCLSAFEMQILTKDVIRKVVKLVINNKLYCPLSLKRSYELKKIWEGEETFSDAQLEQIIIDNPQQHKEAGFEYGWESRFDTWFKFCKELGFIHYSMNAHIMITQTGHMLIDAYTESPCNEKKVQKVYLNAFMKYQTNNPLRKVLNENAPLPLLLNVIKKLNADPEENGVGIARHELPILICWIDNDSEAVYQYIKNIRKTVGFKCSDEYIYEKCLEILRSDNRNYFKIDKICYESVDEYIRKMRMSGLLSLRGNGRFLDINKFEEDAANYVIANYSQYEKFATEKQYIDYMGKIDANILNTKEASETETDSVKQKKLKEYAYSYPKNEIFEELRIICSKKVRESKDPVLKYIPAPTRLEFLTSIAMLQNFKDLKVCPNYPVDDEGLPTSTAAGGYSDIECFDSDYDTYCEVTLMCGRTEQVNNEVIPISRHLQDAIKERRPESFAVLIAPTIHADTVEACDWQRYKNKIEIIPYNIDEFIKVISVNRKASDLLNNKPKNT